jgi:hypothetical protein
MYNSIQQNGDVLPVSTKYKSFMKFRPVGVVVFHGEEMTEMTKLSVAVHFFFFAKTSEKAADNFFLIFYNSSCKVVAE